MFYSDNPVRDAERYFESISPTDYEQEERENAEMKIDELHDLLEDMIPDDDVDEWELMEEVISNYYKGYNTADDTIFELQVLLNKYIKD